MTFAQWYAKRAIPAVYNLVADFLDFLFYYFSFRQLILTLFDPWKLQTAAKTSPGFDLGEWFSNLSFNLISRGIGGFIRLSTILFGFIIVTLAVPFTYFVGFLFIIFPPLLLPFYFKEKDSSLDPRFDPDILFRHFLRSPFANFMRDHALLDLKTLKNEFHHAFTEHPDVLHRGSASQIFREIVSLDPTLRAIAKSQNLEPDDLEHIVHWYEREEAAKRRNRDFWSKEYLMTIPRVGEYWSNGYTPTLDVFCDDLSAQNLRRHAFNGRKAELDRLILYLKRKNQPNVILIGDPGTGKHSLIIGLAKLIQLNELPQMKEKRVLLLRTDQFLSNTSTRNAAYVFGEFIKEASAARNIILVIPDIHLLAKSQAFGALEAAAASSPYVPLIGLTTQNEYFTYIHPIPSMTKQFSTLELKPLSADDTLDILLDHIPEVDAATGLKVPYQTARHIVNLTDRYQPNDSFPEKAFDVLDDLVVLGQSEHLTTVLPDKADYVFSLRTNIPVGELDKDERQKLLNLEDALGKQIIGQEAAVTAIAKALRRNWTDLRTHINKPIGSFLFLGPTGVGKTLTAKTLASIYFKTTNFIRFDMSEYQTQDGVERLIGSFVTKKPGLLPQKILTQPYGLLLLDEFEKAPRIIQNLFLNILDEGYFTSVDGMHIDCRNLIIIATSNAGTEIIRQYLRQYPNDAQFEHNMTEYLLQHNVFPPELMNRFDCVVFFKPFNETELKKVVKLMLKELKDRLKTEKEIDLSFSQETIKEIMEQGYDPSFGARGIERYIQDTLQDKIARILLENPQTRQVSL